MMMMKRRMPIVLLGALCRLWISVFVRQMRPTTDNLVGKRDGHDNRTSSIPLYFWKKHSGQMTRCRGSVIRLTSHSET